MNKKNKIKKIRQILHELYPAPPIPLQHTSPYTLLIAVLLSAQCTDVRVNQVTPILFSRANTPYKMIELQIEGIKNIIRSCGLSQRKAKAIWHLSEILIKHYGGKVPCSFEELESLPGVGHKTASVVMSQAFHSPAFPVDTHIHRLAKRWGLSSGINVTQTERDLKKIFPKKEWNRLHIQMIYFGREYCPARGHDIELCPICSCLNQ
jgi:endonuclease-3